MYTPTTQEIKEISIMLPFKQAIISNKEIDELASKVLRNTDKNGVLRSMTNTLCTSISNLINSDMADESKELLNYSIQLVRIFEKKLDETIDAIKTLIANGFKTRLMIRQLEALEHIRGVILPQLEPAFSALDTLKEKKFTNLRKQEEELRKYMYMVETGIPPPEEQVEEAKG